MVFHQSEIVQDPNPKQHHGDIVNPTSTSITRGGASICREPILTSEFVGSQKPMDFLSVPKLHNEKISLDFTISRFQISQDSQPCGIRICFEEARYLTTLQISA